MARVAAFRLKIRDYGHALCNRSSQTQSYTLLLGCAPPSLLNRTTLQLLSFVPESLPPCDSPTLLIRVFPLPPHFVSPTLLLPMPPLLPLLVPQQPSNPSLTINNSIRIPRNRKKLQENLSVQQPLHKKLAFKRGLVACVNMMSACCGPPKNPEDNPGSTGALQGSLPYIMIRFGRN